MSYLEKLNRVWKSVRFTDNRGIVILGLLECYINTKRVLSVEELKSLLPITSEKVTPAYNRIAKEFLTKSRKLTVFNGAFRDVETREAYKGTPYNGRSLQEALEILIAEAKKNNITFKKVLKTELIEKVNTPLNNDIDSRNKEYLPTREDFESAYKTCAPVGGEILIDEILDQIEINAKDAGRRLKSDWRIITEKNILDTWSKTKED